MFSVKSDIVNWSNDFLNKNEFGQYICPFDKTPVNPVRVSGGWKFAGRSEEWLWSVEDLKNK